MKKKIVTLILCTLLMIIPFVSLLASVIGTPSQYSQSYFAGLKLKHDRLSSVTGEKIVLIGGSNLAFGVDSVLLEEYVGLPIVNYGLYAALGTKAMLDMAKPYINKGDTVIICPEEDKQTYSLYYNGLNMWYALDCDYTLIKDVGIGNYDKLLASLPEFAAAKRKMANSPAGTQSGIYALSSLNEYGDINVYREYNIMSDFGKSLETELNKELVQEDFTDYLNDFASDIEKRGAKVYFAFSPINRISLISSDEEIEEFSNTLKEQLDFPIISDINDYILDTGYFYDTNFHMNSCGMIHRTSLLASDINKALGRENDSMLLFLDPTVRPDNWLAAVENEDDAENAANFIFEEKDGTVTVVGLTDKGLEAEKLVLPNTYESKAVVAIAAEAFAASKKLEVLSVPANSSLNRLEKRAFALCPTLRRIELATHPSKLTASSELFDGAHADCKIYVSRELYKTYVTDYFWCSMTEYIDTDEK